jgi:integrase
MDPERQLGALANGFHEAVDGVRRERPAALSLEDERTRRIPLQLAQHAQFIAPDRMNCGLAILRPADVQRRIATPQMRTREYLTPDEVEKLIAAAKLGRHGHRDATLILVAFRHGLRAVEVADLEWSQVEHSAFVSALSEKCCLARRFGTTSIFPSILVATYG